MNLAFPLFKSISKTLALALPIALPVALVICAPSANAQAFDVSALSGGATVNSGGSAGSSGVTSYKTGEAPEDANMSGIKTGFTTKQRSGPMGTPQLRPTYLGNLAPSFGGLSGYNSNAFNINLNIDGFNLGLSDGPGGIGLNGFGQLPGGINIQTGLPGMSGPPGFPGLTTSLPGVPGPPGGFPGSSGFPGPPGFSSGFPAPPGFPGSFSDPTIGANFNVGGANVNVSTDLNSIESGLSSIGSDFGF